MFTSKTAKLIACILLGTLALTMLYTSSPSDISATQLFRKHNLKGTQFNPALTCIRRRATELGCTSDAVEKDNNNLSVVNDFQSNYAKDAKAVKNMTEQCFYKQNPTFWTCMEQVYTECLNSSKDNAVLAQENNQGLQNFPELAPSLYHKDCRCKMTWKDIPKKQQLVRTAAELTDYVDLKGQISVLEKDSEYFTCVNEKFLDIPVFTQKEFEPLNNKQCQEQFSTRILNPNRFALEDLIEFSDNKKTGFPELRKEILDKKLNNNSEYFSCLLRKVDNHLPVPDYPFKELNSKQCNNKLDVNKDGTGFTKLSIIELAEKSKKFKSYDEFRDAFLEAGFDKRSDYYTCVKDLMFKEWKYQQFSNKQFSIFNGECNKQFEYSNQQQKYDEFVLSINKNKKINDLVSFEEEYSKQNFNHNDRYINCLDKILLKNYPVEKIKDKEFAALQKFTSQNCDKKFDEVSEIVAYNKVIAAFNKSKDQTWTGLNDQTFDLDYTTNFSQCFAEIFEKLYPVTKLTNKDLSVLNGKCDNKFESVDYKQMYNGFAEIVNKNTNSWETFYAEFKKDQILFSLNKGFATCLVKEVFDNYPVSKFDNKDLEKLGSKCEAQSNFKTVEDKQEYNKFVDSVNKNKKVTDDRTLYSAFSSTFKDFEKSKDKYVQCLDKQIEANYPINKFDNKDFQAQLGGKCDKTMATVDDKENYDAFVDVVNKDAKNDKNWTALDKEFKAFKQLSKSQKLEQCMAKIIDAQVKTEASKNAKNSASKAKK